MTEKQKRRNSKPKTSPEVLRAIFYDVKFSKLTLTQIAAKHKISSASVISRWVKKYSSDFEPMNHNPLIANGHSDALLGDLSSNEQKLQKALEEAKMKIICLETIIDIAEQELKVNIRKKPGTKQ